MKHVRLALRLVFFSIVLFWYFVTALIVVLFYGLSFDRARHLLTVVIGLTCKMGLWIFNIEVEVEGSFPEENENFLIVCNHLSYLDVFAISSQIPTSFVTSHEMRKTPFLGHLCQFGGCLFVDRKNRRNLGAEITELTMALARGITVTIFPEATSTNGEEVRTFRKPLFQAAINAQKKILPLCLNYESLDGESITLKNRDKVFWYGDFPFFSHAMDLFAHKKLKIRLTVLPVIDVASKDKYQLTSETQNVISDHYKTIN